MNTMLMNVVTSTYMKLVMLVPPKAIIDPLGKALWKIGEYVVAGLGSGVGLWFTIQGILIIFKISQLRGDDHLKAGLYKDLRNQAVLAIACFVLGLAGMPLVTFFMNIAKG